MGITNNNPLLTGVRGRIGNLVVKQYKNGTVITAMPSYTKRKPTPLQKIHRAVFAEAVKHAKAEKLKHLMKYGGEAASESTAIYHRSIQEFMLAIRRIKQNDVNFESSWEGLSDKEFTAEMIKLAKSIVSGEYDKKWPAPADEKATAALKKTTAKKAALKKAALKKLLKKNAGRK